MSFAAESGAQLLLGDLNISFGEGERMWSFDAVLIYLPSLAVAALIAADSFEQKRSKQVLSALAREIADCDRHIESAGYYTFGHGPENWKLRRDRLLDEFRTRQSGLPLRGGTGQDYTYFLRRQ